LPGSPHSIYVATLHSKSRASQRQSYLFGQFQSPIHPLSHLHRLDSNLPFENDKRQRSRLFRSRARDSSSPFIVSTHCFVGKYQEKGRRSDSITLIIFPATGLSPVINGTLGIQLVSGYSRQASLKSEPASTYRGGGIGNCISCHHLSSSDCLWDHYGLKVTKRGDLQAVASRSIRTAVTH
jgi:hypothetical protein